MPSRVEAEFDGRRRGKDMFLIRPFNTWGSKAYGLSRREDDYTMSPNEAERGDNVVLVVADRTFLRLARQRDRRRGFRGRR